MLCVIFIRPVVSRNIFPEYRHLFKRVKREKDLTYPPSITQQHLIIVIMIMGRRALLFYLVWGVCVCPCECVCVCWNISVCPPTVFLHRGGGTLRSLEESTFPLSLLLFLPPCLSLSFLLFAGRIYILFTVLQNGTESDNKCYTTWRAPPINWTEASTSQICYFLFFFFFFFFFFLQNITSNRTATFKHIYYLFFIVLSCAPPPFFSVL